jgi:hypothetical protein
LKKYVSNLLNFVGIKNEIVYKIEDNNNICFIPPLCSLNVKIHPLFNYYNEKFKMTLTKQQKTLLGVGAVAVAAYLIWKQTQEKQNFILTVSKRCKKRNRHWFFARIKDLYWPLRHF